MSAVVVRRPESALRHFPVFVAMAGFIALGACRNVSPVGLGMPNSTKISEAKAELEAGEFASALMKLESIAAVSGENAEVACLRGRALYGLDRYSEAVEACSKAIAQRPDWSEALLGRARAWIRLNEIRKARADLERFVELNPNSIDGYIERAKVRMEWFDYDLASDDWTRAIELASEPSADMYAQRALCLQEMCPPDSKEKHAEVLAEADRAITLDPNHIRAWHIRFHELQELQSPIEDRLQAIRRLLVLAPNEPQYAIDYLIELLETRNDELIAKEATRFIDLGFADQKEQLFFLRADARYGLGQYEAALEDFQEGFKRTSKDLIDAHDYSQRAHCYSKLRRFDEAQHDYETALKMDPRDPWTYADRAELYVSMYDYEAALKDLDAASRLHLFPMRVRRFLEIRLKCYESLGRVEDAAQIRENLASLPLDEE